MNVCARSGLTLVEVLIAMAIVAVGVFAAFGMQATSLQGTRSAILGQEIANIASSEIDLQRSFQRTVVEPSSGLTCRTPFERPTYVCTVTVYPCSYGSGVVSCMNLTVTGSVARQIVVTVTGPQNRRLTLSTVVK